MVSNDFCFPLEKEEIGGDDFSKVYKWFRPEVIYDTSNYRILPDKISLNDIVQGCINDSYFLTALIALCRYPKIIEKRRTISKVKVKPHLIG